MADKLTKQEVRKSAFIWFRKKLTVFGMERLQTPGMQLMLEPLINHYYKDDKEATIRILTKHSVFFNTEPATGACIPGIVLALEEDIANGADVPDDFIQNIKVGLMGPFAGIGDALNQATIPPIMKSIALGLATNGSPAGAFFYAAWNIVYPLVWTIFWFERGYNLGTKAADSILGEGMARLQGAMAVAGLTVTGAICAQFVSFTLKAQIVTKYVTINFQNILDSLFPKILQVGLVFLGWQLMTKKGWQPLKLMAAYLVATIVLCLLGIL